MASGLDRVGRIKGCIGKYRCPIERRLAGLPGFECR
ncbi:hypothetical protein OROGR_013962 [Orobanche gracilis]